MTLHAVSFKMDSAWIDDVRIKIKNWQDSGEKIGNSYLECFAYIAYYAE